MAAECRSTTSTRSRASSCPRPATATSFWSCPPARSAACTRRSWNGCAHKVQCALRFRRELTLGFADDANALIEQKKFDELESLWMNQLDSDPRDTDAFLRTAKALRKAEQRTLSDTLVGLLADSLLERKLWPQRLAVLKELGRLSKHPSQLRQPIEQALRGAPPAVRAGPARRVRPAPRLPPRLRALRLQ